MFRSYSLQPVTVHNDVLSFEWDSEAGVLRGSGAELVAQMCDSAAKEGYVVGHPYPTSFVITDPLHRLSEMAVVLGQYWRLESELSAAYPKVFGDGKQAYPKGTSHQY